MLLLALWECPYLWASPLGYNAVTLLPVLSDLVRLSPRGLFNSFMTLMVFVGGGVFWFRGI